MERNYAPSGSERPMSEGVGSAGGNLAGNESVGEPARVSRATNGMDIENSPRRDVVNDGTYEAGGAGTNLFLLVTLGLALIGWIVTLVAQADVAAKINNDLVRILWFGVIIQTIVTILVAELAFGIIFVYEYAMQVSILAALATGFAVLGVDRNIYSNAPAQQATGAGWLIIAIVDLVWIIYFTSPPHSHFVRLANSARGPISTRLTPITKVRRSADAFAMGAVHGNNSRMSQGPSVPLEKPVTASGVWSGTGDRRTVGSIPGSQQDANAGSVLAGSTHANTHPEDGAVAATAAQRASNAASLKPDENAIGRAEALFDYNGSNRDPNELTFLKGEILLVFDTKNKWWEAQTSNGKRGIAPSNYLRMLEENP